MTSKCAYCDAVNPRYNINNVPFCQKCWDEHDIIYLTKYSDSFKKMELGERTAADEHITKYGGHPGSKCSPVNKRCKEAK